MRWRKCEWSRRDGCLWGGWQRQPVFPRAPSAPRHLQAVLAGYGVGGPIKVAANILAGWSSLEGGWVGGGRAGRAQHVRTGSRAHAAAARAVLQAIFAVRAHDTNAPQRAPTCLTVSVVVRQ